MRTLAFCLSVCLSVCVHACLSNSVSMLTRSGCLFALSSLLQTTPNQGEPPSGAHARVFSEQHLPPVPSSLVRHTRNRSLDSGTAQKMLENSDLEAPKQGYPPKGEEESKESCHPEGEESKEAKFTVGEDSPSPRTNVALHLEEVSAYVYV